MILKWSKFNESENQELITRDIIQEVLFFRWFAIGNTSDQSIFLHRNLEKIINKIQELNLSVDITNDNIDKIYNNIINSENIELKDLFIESFNLISEEMEGFPRFYDIEDCLLSYLDEGYEIDYEYISRLPQFGHSTSMSIMVKKNINISEYSELINSSTHIINRLKNLTKKEIFVSDSEYVNKDESCLKIKIQ
jgi:hypothetical protein